jgi:hypothetical protein
MVNAIGNLPTDILLKILKTTNDNTIYSLANTCHMLCDTMRQNKQKLVCCKYNSPEYDYYGSIKQYFNWTDIKPIQLDIVCSWKDTHELSMYVSTLMLLHKIGEENDFDAITSILVKGDVSSVTLTIGQEFHMTIDIKEFTKNQILHREKDGTVEVLRPFMEFIPTHSLHRCGSFISLQSGGGALSLTITKTRLSTMPSTISMIYKTPSSFYYKECIGFLPKFIIIPVSCTWSKDFACIMFSKDMRQTLDKIQLMDAKLNKVYSISCLRLEASFVKRMIDGYSWLNTEADHTKYIVPLTAHGGMYYIILVFKDAASSVYDNIAISGVKWQRNVLGLPKFSEE